MKSTGKDASATAGVPDLLLKIETIRTGKAAATRIRGELGSLHSRLSAANNHRMTAQDAVNGYSKRPEDAARLDYAIAARDAAKAEIDALRLEIAAREAELENLEAILADTDVRVTYDAARTHKQECAAVSDKVSALQRLRAEIVSRLDAAPAPAQNDSLKREREDILADLAMGEPREADLASVDSRIRAAEEAAAPALARAAAAASAAREALAGIDRKLISADDELRRLQSYSADLVGHLIANEMLDLAIQYEAAVTQSSALLLRITALDNIRKTNAPKVPSGLDFGYTQHAIFPMLLTKQSAMTYQTIAGHLGEHIKRTTNAEADRLKALGVALK